MYLNPPRFKSGQNNLSLYKINKTNKLNLIPMHTNSYPQQIDCVYHGINDQVGSIYLGNIEAASNLIILKKFNIKAVISVAKGTFLKHNQVDLPNYLYIPADDIQSFDISKFFQQTYSFLDKNLKKSNVLVHCVAGISRSATIVIAYLMKKKSRGLIDIYTNIKRKRQIINPNKGFLKQLKQYQFHIKIQKTEKIQNNLVKSKIQKKTSIDKDIQSVANKKKNEASQNESKKIVGILQNKTNIYTSMDKFEQNIDKLRTKLIQSISIKKRNSRAGSSFKNQTKNCQIFNKSFRLNLSQELKAVDYPTKCFSKAQDFKYSNFGNAINQSVCFIQQ